MDAARIAWDTSLPVLLSPPLFPPLPSKHPLSPHAASRILILRYVCVCVFVCLRVCVCLCVCLCVFVCVFVCVYVPSSCCPASSVSLPCFCVVACSALCCLLFCLPGSGSCVLPLPAPTLFFSLFCLLVVCSLCLLPALVVFPLVSPVVVLWLAVLVPSCSDRSCRSPGQITKLVRSHHPLLNACETFQFQTWCRLKKQLVLSCCPYFKDICVCVCVNR